MIVVANRIPVAAGYEAEFEVRFQQRRREVENAAGFIRNLVLRPSDKEGYYVVMTFWENQAAFEAWTQSDAFVRGHAQSRANPKPEMYRGRNLFEMHEVIQDTEQEKPDTSVMPGT